MDERRSRQIISNGFRIFRVLIQKVFVSFKRFQVSVSLSSERFLYLSLGFSSKRFSYLWIQKVFVSLGSKRCLHLSRGSSRSRSLCGTRYWYRLAPCETDSSAELFSDIFYYDAMYNIAYLRETVRRMVHRVYVGRKCTIYLRISVPRYLRDRGHETDTLVPRISRSIGLASSAARPTPTSFVSKSRSESFHNARRHRQPPCDVLGGAGLLTMARAETVVPSSVASMFQVDAHHCHRKYHGCHRH
jgi:hypothetical protein